jgi:hypothetical protein
MAQEILMEEVERDAVAAIEPGELVTGQSVPDADKRLEAKVIELKSAGYVYIYDTQTHERSKINRNMLTAKLRQKRNDGTFIFTTKKLSDPHRGTLKCMLHPDDPNRKHYDDLGLPVCMKSNLTAPHQVKLHMMHRHKTEFATIEAEKAEVTRNEDREYQRAILNMVTGKATVKPLKAEKAQDIEPDDLPFTPDPESVPDGEPEIYVSDKDKKAKKKK